MTARSGGYRSDDRRVSSDWAIPEWSGADRLACRLGFHIKSRKVAVRGYVNYFSSIAHAYCACGRRRWMWFEDGWLSVTGDVVEPGSLEAWVESMVTFGEAAS